jgi:hypothetical protein
MGLVGKKVALVGLKQVEFPIDIDECGRAREGRNMIYQLLES